MKDLQKYYAHDEDLGTERNSDEDHCLYKQRDVTPLIAEMRREHAEHIARIEASTIELQRSLEQKLQETKQALMREHAEEIERLKAELGIYRESLQKREEELRVCAGTIRGQAAEIEFLTSELQRFKDLCDNHKYQDRAQSIDLLRKQAERYEKLRSLNVRDFQALYMRNIRGEGRFDDLLDQLPASRPVEVQDGRVE